MPLADRQSALSYHVPGGDIGTAWRDPSFTDPSGLFLTQSGGNPLYPGVGYDTKGEYDPLLSTFLATGTTTACLRVPFQVADPAALSGLALEMQYDDAFVAWLNGVEVARSGGAPATPVWNSRSSVVHNSALDQGENFDLTAYLGQLRAGSNVLAIQVFNQSSGSSDLLADPRLTAAIASSGTSYLTSNTPGTANAGGSPRGRRSAR